MHEKLKPIDSASSADKLENCQTEPWSLQAYKLRNFRAPQMLLCCEMSLPIVWSRDFAFLDLRAKYEFEIKLVFFWKSWFLIERGQNPSKEVLFSI